MLHRSTAPLRLEYVSVQLEPPSLPGLGGVLSLGLGWQWQSFCFSPSVKDLLSLPTLGRVCRPNYFNQSFTYLIVKVKSGTIFKHPKHTMNVQISCSLQINIQVLGLRNKNLIVWNQLLLSCSMVLKEMSQFFFLKSTCLLSKQHSF